MICAFICNLNSWHFQLVLRYLPILLTHCNRVDLARHNSVWTMKILIYSSLATVLLMWFGFLLEKGKMSIQPINLNSKAASSYLHKANHILGFLNISSVESSGAKTHDARTSLFSMFHMYSAFQSRSAGRSSGRKLCRHLFSFQDGINILLTVSLILF